MTNDELITKRMEILHESNLEIDKTIAKLKKEGKWSGGLTSDPPEIRKIKEKAYAEIAELAKQVE